MKNIAIKVLLLIFCFGPMGCLAQSSRQSLKLVFIRHGEKDDDGYNLSCKGFNRSVLLPAVLYKKFGVPGKIYVPAVSGKGKTKHLRMMQTITPFAIKYRVDINSSYDADDYDDIANALLKEKGVVFIVWEHNTIPAIVKDLAHAARHLYWPDSDFDSIWIVTFKGGKPAFSVDSENLKPADNCSF